ncbi:calcyclin-binding protein isoform X2 [Anthonomus grandis grandis]|uniref:calcyclin-binding protein isoform X2 n=1 Tax=Anthonomus grandis grandis TaxID=2921223 RepID=UPI002165B2EF|nr:calcyclin-binding protein isoform X2 [Anthonomus grandis grandis]
MANKIEELKKDIAEMEYLETHVIRQKVKDILSIEKRKLISEVVRLEEKEKENEMEVQLNVPQVSVKPSTNLSYEVKITNYAWDQSQKFLKFYITLPKVNTVPAENITCDFQEKSLELKVKNLENKDYVFRVTQLLNSIEPKNSTFKVKNDLILINAAKKEDTHWTHVTEWEKKAQDRKLPSFDNDDKSDPTSSLMNIMKNMYATGDDEMKRTIAKAWTESQSKGPTI